MMTETQTRRAGTFVNSRLPWILGAGMFALFLTMLDRGLTPRGLAVVVDISGWAHRPHNLGPVMFLMTYPLRWLPISLAPVILNLFSAVCAALSLVLLARSVSILPHDRTFEQREREQNEFSFLTIPAAWVPPLFAVLVCGLQLTFWEDAIQASIDMFDLLLTAYVIRCLLEYRIAQKDSWMLRAAVLYGLGMANNWAMVAFFPAFLMAVIWIKSLGFFNPQFLLRLALAGLAGLSLILLIPVLNMTAHLTHDSFWKLLHTLAVSEKMALKSVPKATVLLLALTSFLPLFVIGIRWASYFGDNSPLGIFLATTIFHIVHGLFFIACLWVALDAPISPRNSGLGYRFLPVYYLGALSIGYFSGYFLLVFGTKVTKARQTLHPLLRTTNLCVTALVWLLLVAVPLIMVGRNFPHLRTAKMIDGIYDKYFAQVEASLPAQGAVVLSDDPFRLYYLQAVLNRLGKGSTHLLIDTGPLINDPYYVEFLARQNPRFKIAADWSGSGTNGPTVIGVVRFLERLSQGHELYYIHPSFGFFFERFSQEAHGLVYRLIPYPAGVWDMPLPTSQQVAQNRDFWKEPVNKILPGVSAILNRPESAPATNLWQYLLVGIHLKEEKDWLALPVGGFYARSLNYWGVELERSGLNAEAGKGFNEALAFNPFNVSARINSAFNTNVMAGKEFAVQPPKDIEDYFGQRRTWSDVLNTDGPLDEPTFRDALAGVLAGGGNYRQAVQNLDRVRQIAPLDPRIPLQLAQLLLYSQTYTNSLSVLLPPAKQCYAEAETNAEAVLSKYPDLPAALFLKSVALMQAQAYDRAIPPLSRLLKVQPENYAARLNRAIAYFKTGSLDPAREDYDAVGKVAPNAYQVFYGLGEIAYQQKNTAAAVRNYQLYLSNAPPDTEEAVYVAGRLKEIGGAPPPSNVNPSH
jgi:tetratricopeptide (TPR) repeat protein